MADLFDMRVRALRRDRAATAGAELFLFDRVFDDCLERIALVQRRFCRALLVGCPNPGWPVRLREFAQSVEVRDPGTAFAKAAGGELIVEDAWEPALARYDLVLAIGTLDTVNDLRLALRLIRHGMSSDGLLIGAVSGGNTMPQLRAAMRAADALAKGATPHIHPRIEASALAPLLTEAGFTMPVVDVERMPVAYSSLDHLVADLRAMAGTNILSQRSRAVAKSARVAAIENFAAAGKLGRTVETFEILHFAAWTGAQG